MEGDFVLFKYLDSIYGFNPRPRMEGDEKEKVVKMEETKVSIHAPAWRATSSISFRGFGIKSFNPRPRMEGDKKVKFNCNPLQVSIHAPAWRATNFLPTCWIDETFQSTPPHGGRLAAASELSPVVVFQSTPPHGGRPLKS